MPKALVANGIPPQYNLFCKTCLCIIKGFLKLLQGLLIFMCGNKPSQIMPNQLVKCPQTGSTTHWEGNLEEGSASIIKQCVTTIVEKLKTLTFPAQAIREKKLFFCSLLSFFLLKQQLCLLVSEKSHQLELNLTKEQQCRLFLSFSNPYSVYFSSKGPSIPAKLNKLLQEFELFSNSLLNSSTLG